jgi:D-alanyl-D-alanine carboxypeptidase (penicillin-binding protein 5/6)
MSSNTFVFLVSLLLGSCAWAAPVMPDAPRIEARAWLLIDAQSGSILAQQGIDTPIEPASLTKLMTSYLVFDALKSGRLKRDQTLTISEHAWHAEGARMYLDMRKPVKVEDLILGMTVQSANDATLALAEAVAGDEAKFVERMNSTAKQLGMRATHFANATGHSHPEHRSTAHDLATLTLALIRDFPTDYKRFSIKEFAYAGISQTNRNRLLWLDPNVDGVKTGQTARAGYCLIASTHRDARRLIAVVLGAATDSARATESQKLLNHGLEHYETMPLYKAGQAVSVFRVFKGRGGKVSAGFTNDFLVTVPRGAGDSIKAEIIAKQPILAPIDKGQTLATLRLKLGDTPFADYPLVALHDVPVSNLFGRMWDSLMLSFK